MSEYKYFVTLTKAGREMLAYAIANETVIDFTEMAVGDSNGISYEPTPDMTSLKHEVYRGAIGSMKVNAEDKNILEFEFVIPADSGGYYVREAGLYSNDGTLMAIARLPEQYKADMSEGAGSSMTVRFLIALSTEAQIVIKVPASITYATQTYVAEEFKNHLAEDDPHKQYLKKSEAESVYERKAKVAEYLEGKADSDHNHEGVYSKPSHNHDTVYSKTDHSHSNYAASSHSHSDYSLTSHNHDSVYAKIANTATKPVMITTADGVWIETKLANGKVRLEGWGVVLSNTPVYLSNKKLSDSSKLINIVPPKQMYGLSDKKGDVAVMDNMKNIGLVSSGSQMWYTIHIINIEKEFPQVFWYITGYLK